jgi:hypothetical protein
MVASPKGLGPEKLWQAPAAYTKDRPVLSSERALHKNKTELSNSNKYLVMSPRWGSTPKIYWLTVRRNVTLNLTLTWLKQNRSTVAGSTEGRNWFGSSSGNGSQRWLRRNGKKGIRLWQEGFMCELKCQWDCDKPVARIRLVKTENPSACVTVNWEVRVE